MKLHLKHASLSFFLVILVLGVCVGISNGEVRAMQKEPETIADEASANKITAAMYANVYDDNDPATSTLKSFGAVLKEVQEKGLGLTKPSNLATLADQLAVAVTEALKKTDILTTKEMQSQAHCYVNGDTWNAATSKCEQGCEWIKCQNTRRSFRMYAMMAELFSVPQNTQRVSVSTTGDPMKLPQELKQALNAVQKQVYPLNKLNLALKAKEMTL